MPNAPWVLEARSSLRVLSGPPEGPQGSLETRAGRGRGNALEPLKPTSNPLRDAWHPSQRNGCSPRVKGV